MVRAYRPKRRVKKAVMGIKERSGIKSLQELGLVGSKKGVLGRSIKPGYL